MLASLVMSSARRQHMRYVAERTGPRERLPQGSCRAHDQEGPTHGRTLPATVRPVLHGRGRTADGGIFKPDRPTPPARLRCKRMPCSASGQSRAERCESGRARRSATDVEYARLIDAGGGQQRVPSATAEQRPERDRSHVHALIAQILGAIPRLRQPAQLLLARAAIMDFGDRDRGRIAVPRLLYHAPQTGRGRLQHPDRLDIGIALPVIAAMRMGGIALHAMVEEPLAGQIMVDADDVWRTGIGRNGLQPVLQPVRGHAPPQRMTAPYAPEQQVPCRPAPDILERSLLAQLGSGEGAAEILRLNEPRGGIDPANGLHREPGSVDLVEERAPERALVADMRIPMAIKRRKARRGERLIDRRPLVDPGIALRNAGREISETPRETVIVEEMRVGGTAAVMDKPGNDVDAMCAQPVDPRIHALPEMLSGPIRRNAFP